MEPISMAGNLAAKAVFPSIRKKGTIRIEYNGG